MTHNILHNKFNNIIAQTISDSIKKTYMLLSVTLLFSFLTCIIGIQMNTKPMTLPMILLLTLIDLALIYSIHSLKNNQIRLLLIFLFTGLSGYTIAPNINHLLSIEGGSNILMLSLISTASIFFTLSLYAFITNRNLTNLSGFITIGVITIVILMITNIFLHLTIINLIMSGIIIIISASAILYNTQELARDNTDYISTTISLYISLFNIFLSLITILKSALSKD